MLESPPTVLPTPWRLAPFLRLSLATHATSLAALALAPDHWRAVAATLVANHVAISLAGTSPRSTLLGPNLSRLPTGRGNEVALTFDDGPDPEVTPQVLDLLASRGLRASFFVIGQRAERHPELASEIAAHGHLLENHTYHHYSTFSLRSSATLCSEIDRAQKLLTHLCGRCPRYFRAPAGIRSPLLDRLLHPRNLTLTSWTRRGFDTVERRPERVTRRLTQNLEAGDILLLHDGNAARDHHGHPAILESLPRILDEMDARGLKGVPLPP